MIKRILVLIIVFVSLQAFGQETSSSPYSFFGMGLPNFRGTIENRLMGGIEVYSDSIHSNLQNPAGLAELKLVNFNIGASHKSYDMTSGNSNVESTNTSVDYVAIGLPFGKLSAAFGIHPLTSVGYHLENTLEDGRLRNTGSGGTNRVFLGFGYNLFKGFNIGIEGNYNFGNIENTTLLLQDGAEFATREFNRSSLSGFAFNFGATYRAMLTDKLEMLSSFTYTPQADLHSENQREVATVFVFASGQTTVIESLELQVPDSEFRIPSKWTAGLGIGEPRKWFVGGEYTSQQMSDFSHRPFNLDNVTYQNSNQYRLGGFFVPNFRSISSYWSRVTYRAGMRYEETGLNINGEDINEFGISFGASLPLGRMFSNVNIGAEFGQRGTNNAGLIKENFFNLFISLSLNDRWFEKRYYD
jgi:long-subunit fatty acid transport protein